MAVVTKKRRRAPRAHSGVVHARQSVPTMKASWRHPTKSDALALGFALVMSAAWVALAATGNARPVAVVLGIFSMLAVAAGALTRIWRQKTGKPPRRPIRQARDVVVVAGYRALGLMIGFVVAAVVYARTEGPISAGAVAIVLVISMVVIGVGVLVDISRTESRPPR